MATDCHGSQCASILLEWLQTQTQTKGQKHEQGISSRQSTLFASIPYQEDASAIRTPEELAGALEHLEYAVFRRYKNQLTRAERARLDNTIDNALFKADRYALALDPSERARLEDDLEAIKSSVRNGREHAERMRNQAKRADLKLMRSRRRSRPKVLRSSWRRSLRGDGLRGRSRGWHG